MAGRRTLERRLARLGLWLGRKQSWQGVQDPETGGYFEWHVGHIHSKGGAWGMAPHKGFRTLDEVAAFVDQQEVAAFVDQQEEGA